MKRYTWLVLFCLLWFNTLTAAQTISGAVPKNIDRNGYYLFYLHGGVVTNLGDNAINPPVPEYGPYQYFRILDTLREHGFHVISERRQKEIDDSVYVSKIAKQVDSLLKAGVGINNILLVGASAGWNIVLGVSAQLKNPQLKCIIMGGCWPDTYKDYTGVELYGEFLSVIEATDPHGTCSKIFENRKNVKSIREIKLQTGLSHGFIYKPYAAWVDPVVQWFQTHAKGYHARPATSINGY